MDSIQQKINDKYQSGKVTDDLLGGNLNESLGGKSRSVISNNSKMGFGRPKNSRSKRNSVSKTPKRKRIGRKLNAIAASPIGIRKKNVRALVYQDKSASKVKSKGLNTKPNNVKKSKHPRELSLSSDVSDGNSLETQKNEKLLLEDETEIKNSLSPNRSSRTLKKTNKHSKSIK